MDRLRYLLGIATLTVMAVGGWFLFQQLKSDDVETLFQLEVSFLDARGLKTGADVKFRGIQVGSVREVRVDESGSRAVVRMILPNGQSDLVRNNSRFWIVVPRFHGISSGVTGLETLVRDSYVAFSTPELGAPLARGARLHGEEAPLNTKADVTLPSIQRGDLLMRVLLPENHGVAIGARVMFRGMATGEVRSIELAPTGTHVEVRIRILADFRSTVTDASVFWVAKPQFNLNFSLSNPVSVNELGSVMSPYIAYYTHPKTGVPVSDGYPVAAHMARPPIEITDVPSEALKKKAPAKPIRASGPVALVRVVYEATDIDYFSPNDKIRREGTGILYVDGQGNELVVTARSICDAAYFYTETFGERANVTGEKIAVQLPGSEVLQATRIWPEPSGKDMVVLQVQGLPRDYPTTKPEMLEFVEDGKVTETGLTVHVAGELGVPEDPRPLVIAETNLEGSRGGVLFQGEKVIGFVGQVAESDAKPTVVILTSLPDSLRPK